MISIIKETVLSALREWIEQEGDHVLRVGRIKTVRLMLDGLEETANRTIKPIDFPLYFFERHIYQYAACGWSDTSWFLIREDADPDVLKWASDCCWETKWSHAWYDKGGSEWEKDKPHPLYPGFSSMVTFGNKVSPSKRYYKGANLSRNIDSVREGLRKRLGDRCWNKDTLPLDINGKLVYR